MVMESPAKLPSGISPETHGCLLSYYMTLREVPTHQTEAMKSEKKTGFQNVILQKEKTVRKKKSKLRLNRLSSESFVLLKNRK